MAANITPIFAGTPKAAWDTLLTGNAQKDASAGTVYTIFTAGVNGARVEKAVLAPLGTNVATVVRLFVNNGGVNTTVTNNILIAEVTMPATTVTQVAANPATTVAMGLSIAGGYKILATVGTTVAAGIGASIHGGDY